MSEIIKVECSHCQKNFGVKSNRDASKPIKCPHCQKSTEVIGVGEFALEPPQPSLPPEPFPIGADKAFASRPIKVRTINTGNDPATIPVSFAIVRAACWLVSVSVALFGCAGGAFWLFALLGLGSSDTDAAAVAILPTFAALLATVLASAAVSTLFAFLGATIGIIVEIRNDTKRNAHFGQLMAKMAAEAG